MRDEEKSKEQLLKEIDELRKINLNLKDDQKNVEKTKKDLKRALNERKAISESIKELVLYNDLEGRVLWANRAAKKEIDGDEDIEGKYCYEVWHNRDEPCDDCPVFQATEKENYISTEIKSESGKIWFVRGYPVKNEDGKVEGILEIAMDVTEDRNNKVALEESKRKIEELHKIANKMESSHSEEEIYEITVKAAKNILEFYVCSVLIEEEGGLEVKATLDDRLEVGRILPLDESIYSKTYKNNKSYLIDNILEFNGAKPSSPEFKSVISVPIGERGVFQVISDEENHFDDYDLELAELLISHTIESLERIKNEKAIINSERKYRTIFENTGTAKIMFTDDLKIKLVNREFEDLSKYSKTELEGNTNFKGFVYDEDLEKIQNFIDKTKKLSDNKSEKYEMTFINKDGEVRDVLGTISNIPKSNRFIFSLLDTTEIKWVEEELKKSEKKYKTIFENTGTAMAIVRKDTIFELVNTQIGDFFGYTKEELEGKKSWTEFVVEEYLPKMEMYHQKRRKNPEEVPNSYECEVYDKEGNKKNLLLTVDTIPGTDKSLVSMIDITDKKEIEKELEETENIFKTVFDNAAVGMSLLNTEGDFVRLNTKFLKMLGYKREDLSNKNFKDITHPEDIEQSEEKLKKLISKKIRIIHLNKRYLNSDDNPIDVVVSCSLINDEEGVPKYILCQVNKKEK